MFGCENRTTVPLEVSFSVGKSKNCARSTVAPLVKKIIEPNRVEFLMYVRRDELEAPLGLDIEFRHKEQI
jgi:hypothetical protein